MYHGLGWWQIFTISQKAPSIDGKPQGCVQECCISVGWDHSRWRHCWLQPPGAELSHVHVIQVQFDFTRHHIHLLNDHWPLQKAAPIHSFTLIHWLEQNSTWLGSAPSLISHRCNCGWPGHVCKDSPLTCHHSQSQFHFYSSTILDGQLHYQ